MAYVLTGLATMVGMIGFITWLAAHPVIAAILLTLSGTLAIIAVIVIVVVVTASWTRQTMVLGAQLAIESQNNNDQWDAKKMTALAQFGREVAYQTRQLSQPDTPALPLLTQGEWLPDLTEFQLPAPAEWSILDNDNGAET